MIENKNMCKKVGGKEEQTGLCFVCILIWVLD